MSVTIRDVKNLYKKSGEERKKDELAKATPNREKEFDESQRHLGYISSVGRTTESPSTP